MVSIPRHTPYYTTPVGIVNSSALYSGAWPPGRGEEPHNFPEIPCNPGPDGVQ